MCFSSEASFIAATVLLPMGLYGAYQAQRKDKRYLLLACFPIVFAVQQFVEGLIWLELLDMHRWVHATSLLYAFFAFVFWPIYVPISVYAIEPLPARRKILKGLTYFGCIVAVSLYIPVLTGLYTFNASVLKHSLSYGVDEPWSVVGISAFSYWLVTIFPGLLSSKTSLKIMGALLFASFSITLAFFYYAFTSIWCFCAAILSLYIIYSIHQLPEKK